jgi:hypothetical protein
MLLVTTPWCVGGSVRADTVGNGDMTAVAECLFATARQSWWVRGVVVAETTQSLETDTVVLGPILRVSNHSTVEILDLLVNSRRTAKVFALSISPWTQGSLRFFMATPRSGPSNHM